MLTGHEFAEGGDFILKALEKQNIKASFFFTGDFYRNKSFHGLIGKLKAKGHYLGAHSDQHLLYCDWNKRDSLLVTKEQFQMDLLRNYDEMKNFGVDREMAPWFLPPYEWYNDSIARWTEQMGLQLVNFTPGTRSTADYTTPVMKNYRNSRDIYASITNYEKSMPGGLNGFILLVHIGTDPQRTDKFYHRLPSLVTELKRKGYRFLTINRLLTID